MVELSAMRLTKAAELVEARAHETLTYFASFPSNRSRQVKTNNPLERIIREIRRRTRVGRISGRTFSVDVGRSTIATHCEYEVGQRRYLAMETLLNPLP